MQQCRRYVGSQRQELDEITVLLCEAGQSAEALFGKACARVPRKRATDLDIAAANERVGQVLFRRSPGAHRKSVLLAAIEGDCSEFVIGERLATQKNGKGDCRLGMTGKPTRSLPWRAGQIGDRVGKPGKRVDVNAAHEAQQNVVEHVELSAAKPMTVGGQQMRDLAQDAGSAFGGATCYRCLDFGGDQIG